MIFIRSIIILPTIIYRYYLYMIFHLSILKSIAQHLTRHTPRTTPYYPQRQSMQYYYSSEKKPTTPPQTPNAITPQSTNNTQLMDDNYQQIKLKGLSEERQITGVNEFQKDIFMKNTFDIMNPNIQPKIATITTSLGLELQNNEYLTEISLGKIKVKKQNEVFLSEVDPNNIPEYYDVVFDYEKEMSLVGKKIENTQGLSKTEGLQSLEMKISTNKAFEEKSKRQIAKEVFGFEFDFISDRRILLKKLVGGLLMTYFLTSPFIITYLQIKECLNSIVEIEEQRLKEVLNTKRRALVDTLLNKSDFHTI